MNPQQHSLISRYFDLASLRATLRTDRSVALHDAYAAADTVLRRRGESKVVVQRSSLESAYRCEREPDADPESVYVFLAALELLDGHGEREAFVQDYESTREGRRQ
jgi:hypothetical protein